MNRLIAIFLTFVLISFQAQAEKKLSVPKFKVVTFILPDGSPARGMEIIVTSCSMNSHVKNPLTKTAYKTNDKGEIQLINMEKNNEIYFVLRTFVFDIPGYALHVQAYHHLAKIQLIKDHGFDGILVDEDGKPFKQTAIRVSQSIGLIWGQILIPKGTNSVTTNDKGEFTMRQMVLNNTGYTCQADIVFADDKDDAGSYDWKYVFYKKGLKKAEKRIKVVKARGK